MTEDGKSYCSVCGREINGSNLCGDCFDNAYEKHRDCMPGGPDEPKNNE